VKYFGAFLPKSKGGDISTCVYSRTHWMNTVSMKIFWWN